MNIPTGQPIHEAYFGKNKNLVEFEKNIDLLRKRFGTNRTLIGGVGVGVVENTKEWKRCKELLETEFGFHSVSFILMRDNSINACTYPITHSFDGSFTATGYMTASSRGVKYTPKAQFCSIVAITEGLLFHPDFTAGEITAVLLHEIGHNFDTAVCSHMAPFVFIQMVISAMYSLQSLDPQAVIEVFTGITTGRRVAVKGIDTVMQTRLWAMYDTFKWLVSIPSSLISALFGPLLKIIFGTISAAVAVFVTAISPITPLIHLWTGYTSEQVADRFPAMYGYGPEMASALGKFETTKEGTEAIVDKIPVIGHVYGMYMVAIGTIMKLTEPHPQYSARIKALTSIIEKDLSDKRIDKKTKDCIKRDLNKINSEADTLLKERDKHGYSTQIHLAYQDFLRRIYPDGDSKMQWLGGTDTFNAPIEDSIKNAKMR